MKVLAYPCGTKVIITEGNIPGHISKFEVAGENVTYCIHYYDDHKQQEIWLRDIDFTLPIKTNRSAIGFIEATVTEVITKDTIKDVIMSIINDPVNPILINVTEVRQVIKDYLTENDIKIS